MKISDLDESIIALLPVSLQLTTTEIDFEDLPSEIQYIIQKKTTTDNVIEYKDKDGIYDLLPEISIYNDLEIANLRRTVLEYFKNYLLITFGTYPFDTSIGNSIKKIIQTRDVSLQETLLGNEVKNIAEDLSLEFNESIEINNITIDNVPRLTLDNHAYTNFDVKIDLTVLGETSTLTQTVQ
jgi:hypothetical protein